MPRTIRQIRIEGNTACVPLTQGYEAKIDAEDVQLVDGANWYADVALRRDGSVRSVYAATNVPRAGGGQLRIWMHRIICETPEGLETDHVNGDGLDNRRNNLRPATTSENQYNQGLSCANTSGAKGVCWDKKSGKWRASIKIAGRLQYLGLFSDINSARAAYASASAKLHGEFGRVPGK